VGKDGRTKPVWYSPRHKFDSQPWTDGTYRYHGLELTATPQHAPEVTDDQWVEQRHYVDLDGSDAAFTRMFDRQVKGQRGVAA
jgi:hypothetical protein